MRRPPEGTPIPIIVQPTEIPDGPPGGEEISVAVWGPITGEAGGPPGTMVDHLQEWLREATQEKELDTRRLEKIVSLTKLAFQEGHLYVALTRSKMVLLPKGGGEYIGIGLVEVIWKRYASIMNNRLHSYIILQDPIYGLIHGRGIGTSTLEANLDQQIVGL